MLKISVHSPITGYNFKPSFLNYSEFKPTGASNSERTWLDPVTTCLIQNGYDLWFSPENNYI